MDTDNAELAAIYAEDQADRRGDMSPATAVRDRQRHARVLELIDANALHTGPDHFRAAMVMQHGRSLASFRQANELARRARLLGDERGAWLAAASYDRWLVTQGRPQYFGTQYAMRNGRWQLSDVDPAATHEVRARWNAPSLVDAHARADSMNSSLSTLTPTAPWPATSHAVAVTREQLAARRDLGVNVAWAPEPITLPLSVMSGSDSVAIVQLDHQGPNRSHLLVQIYVPDGVEIEHPTLWVVPHSVPM